MPSARKFVTINTIDTTNTINTEHDECDEREQHEHSHGGKSLRGIGEGGG